MKLVQVHRAIRFTASPYFEPYIKKNTQKRRQCKTDEVKRNFYKLINNAPYNKTIENVTKRSDIRLVREEHKARQLAEKPHCLDFRIFEENLIGVEMRKLHHVINKPFQHGFFVLEWSKLKMYTYALLKYAFKDKVRMLYTDTDSLFLQFFVDDLRNKIKIRPAVRDAFDFSNVYDSHLTCLHSIANAGEVGYFKDMCKCHPIVEFVGFRQKMCSFTVMDAEEYDPRLPFEPVQLRHKSVAKGVSRANIKCFTHDDYVTMFSEGDARKVTNRHIGSKFHQVNYGN